MLIESGSGLINAIRVHLIKIILNTKLLVNGIIKTFKIAPNILQNVNKINVQNTTSHPRNSRH